MPGSGKRNKKTKSSSPKTASGGGSTGSVPLNTNTSTTSVASSEFSTLNLALTDSDARDVDGVAASEDWTGAVRRICEFCELPDLNSRKGLKRVYTSFDTYYKRLEAIYARYGEYPRIRAGIIGIYAKMCNDHLLMNKLFNKGFLKKLIPLLEEPESQTVALQALQTVTRHGDVPVRLEISKYAMTLTRILESDPSDYTAELVVSVLSHTLCSAFDGKLEFGQFKPMNPAILKTLDATRIVKAMTEAAMKSSASSSVVFHAIDFLYSAAMHGAYAFKVYPTATKILVAGLSGREWDRRCGCLQALIRLHTLESSDEPEVLDPMKLMLAPRTFSSHISRTLGEYGIMRSDTYLTASCMQEFQKAITKVAGDRDFHALGLVISKNILRTEYSLLEGSFQIQDENGRWVDDPHMPFQMWTDTLPLCAKALRVKKNPQELDMADIINIKYLLMRRRHAEALDIALRAIKRNPHQGYWYYAIAMEGDPVKGLKAAKQGMKCSQLTPFVKYQLLYRAVDHAGNLGVEILQQMPNVGDSKWYEGIALLHSALEDAKMYMAEAPPDNRNLKTVLYWYILLMITVEDLDPELPEIQDAKRRLEMADEIMHLLGSPPPMTKMRLTQQTVVKHYKESVGRFRSLVDKAGSECSHDALDPTSEQNADKLATWLENLDLEGQALISEDVYRVGEESKFGGLGAKTVDLDGESLSLYRCGWCGNPSASLRRCSGCAKVRYCDSSCQRQAWSTHKKTCKKT